MAVDTNRYRNRAADADKRLAFQMQSAGDLSAEIAAIDDEMRRRREEAEKRKRQETQDTLAVNERTYQRGREATQDARQASMDAERSADRAAITDERRARQKRLDDDAAREATEAKRKAVIDEAAGVQGARGIRRAELEAFGAKAGMGPDELLAELDKINQAALGDSRKVMLNDARRNKEDALAKKAGRAPAGPKPMSEAQRRIEAARVRKIEAEAKSAERDANGAGGRGGAPAKPALTAGEVEPIVELQGARNLLDKLATMKTEGDIDTGPIANAVDWMRNKVGVGDPKRVEFKAMIGTQIAEYIKSISGATVSEPERAALLENVPTASDNDDQFMAKLASVKSMIDNKLATKKKAFKATGRQTAIFDDAPSSSGDDEFDSLPD